MVSTECELRGCKIWAGACVTVAAVGITDQSGATALPWVPSGWEFRMWGYFSPLGRGLCAGAPPGGIPAMGRAVPQLTVSYLWF